MKRPDASSETRDFILGSPSPVERAIVTVKERVDELVKERGWSDNPESVNAHNFGEWCEVLTDAVVDELHLQVDSEPLGILEWNEIFAAALNYGIDRYSK